MGDRLNVAIVGSREYADMEQVVAFVNSLPVGTVVVSGGARGVDSIAEAAAKRRGLETCIFPADWTRYGKAAGIRRNVDIVNKADAIVAFWDGRSRGTEFTIELARAKDKPVHVVIAGDPLPGIER